MISFLSISSTLRKSIILFADILVYISRLMVHGIMPSGYLFIKVFKYVNVETTVIRVNIFTSRISFPLSTYYTNKKYRII